MEGSPALMLTNGDDSGELSYPVFEYVRPNRHSYHGKYNLYSRVDVLPIIEKELSASDWSSLSSSFLRRIIWFGNNMKLSQQLLNHFIINELKTSKIREMWFKLESSHPCRFSMSEFAAVTGLKCQSDHPVAIPSVSTKSVLGVGKIKFDSLVVLFLKTPKNSPKKLLIAYILIIDGILLPHRDRVVRDEVVALASDLSRLNDYPLGRLVYIDTITSLMKVNRFSKLSKKTPKKSSKEKVPKTRSGYNLLGFPLALQVWILEAFPKVPGIINCTYVSDDNDRSFVKWSLPTSKNIKARIIELGFSNTRMDTIYPTYGEYLDSPLMCLLGEKKDPKVDAYLEWLTQKASGRAPIPAAEPIVDLTLPISDSPGDFDQVVPSAPQNMVVISPHYVATRTRSKVSSPPVALVLPGPSRKRKSSMSPALVSDQHRDTSSDVLQLASPSRKRKTSMSPSVVVGRPQTDSVADAVAPKSVSDIERPGSNQSPPKVTCHSKKLSLKHAIAAAKLKEVVSAKLTEMPPAKLNDSVSAGVDGSMGGVPVFEDDQLQNNRDEVHSGEKDIGVGNSGITQQLELIGECVMRAEARVLTVKSAVNAMYSKCDCVQAGFDSLNSKCDSLTAKVDTLHAKHAALESKLDLIIALLQSNHGVSGVSKTPFTVKSADIDGDIVDSKVQSPDNEPTSQNSPSPQPSDLPNIKPSPKPKVLVAPTRRSTRVGRVAASLGSPYTRGLKKRAIPKRPKHSYFEAEDRKQFYDWLNSDEDDCPQMEGNEMLMDKAFFSELVGKHQWLRDDHIGEALSHFRKYIADNGDKYGAIVILDWVWSAKFTQGLFRRYKKESMPFTSGFFGYVHGLLPRFCGKSWVSATTVYAPFNLQNKHWVSLQIDLIQGKVNVCDSSLFLYDLLQLKVLLETLCVMLPAILKESGRFSHLGESLDSPFKVERFRDLPQNSDGGSCGVYTIKAIEELAFGQNIYAFDDDHVQAYREKLAIELYKKCWTVCPL